MKPKASTFRRTLSFATLLVVLGMTASAAVRYVDVNSASPTAPYTNWASAATNIQDAVDVAVAGDEIVVTNGVYQTGGRAVSGTMTNRVAVDKSLTLRSVNGPAVTVIRGYQVPGTTNGDGAVRCVYLTNGSALVGFTLTNGATQTNGDYYANQLGGGVWCELASVVVSNCLLTGNSAHNGGGAYSGTLNNCTLTGNSAQDGGGAAGATLNNCTLTGNSAQFGGGGALGGTLNNCTLTGNSAEYGGGSKGGTLNNCMLTGNSAFGGCSDEFGCVGVGGGGANGGTLNNCTLTGNSAQYGGGATGVILGECTLNNCTLSGNSAFHEGGGVGGGAAVGRATTSVTLNNCILYYNTAPDGANYGQGTHLNYCCTIPLPSFNAVGNFTNAPLFVDQAGGNLRLQSNSPCINAGRNTYAPTGLDLDGHPRIVGGMVDVGAYEFQSPQSAISYAWLQGYGLPTDGSVDFTDADGDGLNNWQEWRCLTVPTNALSVLRLLLPTSGTPGVTVRWQSVTNRTYFLERSANLNAQPAFGTLASNLVGQAGTTIYTDTNAFGTGPFFYRVGVEE